jgi:hypothetical protein
MPEKKSKKTEKSAAAESQRRIKSDRHKSFKLEKRIKPAAPKLPNVWRILKGSLGVLIRSWKLFGGIALVYALLGLFLVYGFNLGAGLTESKVALEQSLTGNFTQLATGASLFLQMFGGGTANTGNGAAGAYQFVLTVVITLALIWALRQVYAKNQVRIRDAFYRGMYPLATFVIVLAAVALQLLPAIVGAFLYGQVVSSGIAATTVEMVLWGGVSLVLATFSLYMLSSSLFALYIVCLPDMTPFNALRSARNLVRYRRWTVMRKVIALPIILILAEAAIVIPILIYATPVAPWIFVVLNVAGLAVINSYMYKLYRSLL